MGATLLFLKKIDIFSGVEKIRREWFFGKNYVISILFLRVNLQVSRFYTISCSKESFLLEFLELGLVPLLILLTLGDEWLLLVIGHGLPSSSWFGKSILLFHILLSFKLGDLLSIKVDPSRCSLFRLGDILFPRFLTVLFILLCRRCFWFHLVIFDPTKVDAKISLNYII